MLTSIYTSCAAETIQHISAKANERFSEFACGEIAFITNLFRKPGFYNIILADIFCFKTKEIFIDNQAKVWYNYLISSAFAIKRFGMRHAYLKGAPRI